MRKIRINKTHTLPIYQQIKEQIKQEIISNNLKEGEILPDIKTLAKEIGVSIKTVDRALNELIKEGWCKRRPKKGTFVSYSFKDNENTTGNKRIVIVYHSLLMSSFESDVVQARIYRGIQEESRKKNIDLVFITGTPLDTIKFYIQQSNIKVLGILMLRWEELEEGLVLASEFPDKKIIYLNYYIKNFENTPSNIYGVFNDDFAGGYQMTDYLIRRGYKDIVVFSMKIKCENYTRRIQGVLRALEDNELNPTEELVFIEERRSHEDIRNVGRRLCEKVLSRKTKFPEVIFCMNDILAVGVIEYLATNNISGIKVVGYDNILKDFPKNYHFPTIEVPLVEMGKYAIKILAENKVYPKITCLTPLFILKGE